MLIILLIRITRQFQKIYPRNLFLLGVRNKMSKCLIFSGIRNNNFKIGLVGFFAKQKNQ